MGERVRAGGTVVQLVAAGTLTTEVRPMPQALDGEVVVAPRAVGLCGTDLHAWRGRLDRLPIVPVHDGVAEIVEVGPGVDPALLGARVVVDPVDACGSCAPCRTGHVGVCLDGGYLGMTVDGLLAERIALPAARVVPLPDGVSDVDATVLEPVAIGCRIAASTAGWGAVPPGDCVVVGGGPLGLLIGAVLRSVGWAVTAIEPQAARRELASRLGLTAVSPDGSAEVAPARLVVETSAAAAGTAAALAAAAPGAVIVVLGRSPGAIPSADVLLRELTVVGLRGGSGHYPAAVQLVAEGTVDPATVVTDLFAPGDVIEAFAAHDRDEPPIRAVLHR